MAAALDWHFDFTGSQSGRVLWLVKADGTRFHLGTMSYDRAHRLLSRCLRIRKIPANLIPN